MLFLRKALLSKCKSWPNRSPSDLTLVDVEYVIATLRAGQLPAAMRRWLAAGLERFQLGAELEAALGLASEPLDRRDESLRLVLQLTPGGSDTARCAFVIECLACRKHPSDTARQLLKKLQASGMQMPRSIRHLSRILNGSRAASETENGVLCPDWPVPENVGNTKEQQNDRIGKPRR
jgi:hypothetical protein